MSHSHDPASHDHSHAGGGHAHSHAPKDFGRAFAIGIGLNIAFVILEATYGFIANSVALLADAGHNLSDVLGLVIAWAAAVLSKRPPSQRYTYGLRGTSILAALFNALFLLVAVGGIVWEALQRLLQPQPVEGITVIVVASIGIAINGFTALLFMSGRKTDLNIEGAFLHMAADAAVSLGVVVAAIMIMATGWLRLDPVVSLLIAAVILWGTWRLLRESIALSLNAVPSRIDRAGVDTFLKGLSGVESVHDLHIWPMSTTETALTCHLVVPAGHPGDEFLMRTARELRHQFGIGHVTLQVEIDRTTACTLAPDHVV
jgi:cobalt-zinc-cadmium efflux system protein